MKRLSRLFLIVPLLPAWHAVGAEPVAAVAQGSHERAVTDDDRRHWSYRPLRAVEPPAVTDGTWGRTPIDRFILAMLEARRMRPNAPADRRTLIRRVSLDLIGLPPTPEEVEAFVNDPAPDACERRVDRLLDSPHYGERWGRHWLDVARYADSDGLETDADRPTAYHYRDFVIRALNDDLPYTTFVRWQVAGDEYEPDNPQALAALGFLATAPTQDFKNPMEEERLRFRFNELDDIASTTAAAFLSLTVGCARCHDHKYDAIPTRDYYRLLCAFTTTGREEVFLTSRAQADLYRQRKGEWDKRVDEAEKSLKEWLAKEEDAHRSALRAPKIHALPIGDDAKKLLKEQPDSEEAKKLAEEHKDALRISDDEYRKAFDDDARRRWDELTGALEAVRREEPAAPPTSLAIVDTKPEPEATFLFDRGNFMSPKDRLQLGFLTVLTDGRTPEEYLDAARRERSDPARSTGQRRALADWMTDVDHGAGALLARVIVNRVWQHHFGEGLVRTPGDFGVRSEPPTHPELLEWLTHDFVSGGWRIKRLHRTIMNSAAYQQATAFDADRAGADPDNRLLWRRRPRRLEAEVLRDAVLHVSGTLNTEPYGPAFKAPIPPEAIQARNTRDPYPADAKDAPDTRRRSVYMFHKRVVHHPFMQAFDGPDAAVSCSRRNTTTVAPQALALLNDPFFRDRATDFARRVVNEADQGAIDAIVTRAFALALSRPPTDAERSASVQFVERQIERRAARDTSASADDVRLRAVADFCQGLFSLNEFLYVD